jgi:uncharacterized membrane protein YfcA
MKKSAEKLLPALAGLIAGVLNGLLGAGGGMAVVPMLERAGLGPARSHATSIAVIVPLCALSAALYTFAGSVKIADALPYIPGGLAGRSRRRGAAAAHPRGRAQADIRRFHALRRLPPAERGTVRPA